MSRAPRPASTPQPARPEMRIPRERLPRDPRARDEVLQCYLHEWVPAARTAGGDWLVSARPPPQASYYPDPHIGTGLAWWRRVVGPTPIRDVLFSHTTRSRVGLSLSDAWTLHTFARALAVAPTNRPVVVLHVDDHQDLQAPRLALPPAANLPGPPTDLFTGRPVDVGDPGQVGGAIRSGAIGMGSFLTPLLHARDAQVRHLKPGPPRGRAPGVYALNSNAAPDPLAAPGVTRPAATIGPLDPAGRYLLAEEPGPWLSELPTDAVLLLHVDADAFNNRYDGDSDWLGHKRRHDPPPEQVAAAVREVLDAVTGLLPRVAAAHIALSPGFFPAEFWQPTVEAFLTGLTGYGSATDRPRRTAAPPRPVDPADVRLEAGNGGTGHGVGPGGLFWHVFAEGTRAGSVWLNEERGGDGPARASLTMQLNQASRGRGIGRVAYALAARASGRTEVWLHMRRSNHPSRRAAEHAGFSTVEALDDAQLVMVWRAVSTAPTKS